MGQQQQLFETEPEPWEIDDADEHRVATIVFPKGLAGEFDYLVPEALTTQVEVGRRVRAPLGRGNRTVEGYCVKLETRPVDPSKLKSITKVLDGRSLLSPAMMRLTRWMADYYLCSWGRVLETVVPAGVRARAGTRNVVLLTVSKVVAGRIAQLKLPPKQRAVLEKLVLSKPLTTADLAKAVGCTSAPINALRKKGLIESQTQRVNTYVDQQSPVHRESTLKLNPDQQAALDTILGILNSGRHQTVLMHGVTGSGKTEVYMQAIQEVIDFGRQAIVLVPEISLTPQTRDRFRRRFDRVAVLHSHLSAAERAWHWEQIASGAIQVIVGARSAVFAPTPHLGLIVLDEEHEGSFKQNEVPRYHARDVALQRAEAEHVPLVLGSATPALESWQRVEDGHYQLVSLPRRVMQRPLPDVVTVDLRDDFHRRGSSGAISRKMHQAIGHSLKNQEQVILLLNRRGFSTQIQCPSCGYVVICPHCDLSLTHHRQVEKAICHYCDYEVASPTECPECKSASIRYSGRGTQKLEAEVRARFPGVSCLRMDTDSMQRPGSHEAALAKFRNGEVQILLGTQMIAKGLDFPNVTLVGVINADTALHLPDFRAAERTFHLVTQVAGRTGRGDKGGRVLVQSYTPEHEAIQAAVRHDFERFARTELPIRKAHSYPPFSTMIRIIIRGPAEDPAHAFSTHIADMIRQAEGKHGAEARVLGPAPAPMPKLRGKFRFHIQIQSVHGERLRNAVSEATADLKPPEGIQWVADVDPVDML